MKHDLHPLGGPSPFTLGALEPESRDTGEDKAEKDVDWLTYTAMIKKKVDWLIRFFMFLIVNRFHFLWSLLQSITKQWA